MQNTNEKQKLKISAMGYCGPYDSQSHGGDVSVNIKEGTQLLYSVDNGISWTSTQPTIKDVGIITVLIKAENKEYKGCTSQYILAVTPEKEKYNEILSKFRTLTAIKSSFQYKMKAYIEKAKTPTEEKITYRSSSDTSEARTTGSFRRDGPHVSPTIAFKGMAEDLMVIGCYLSDLEEALYAAIRSATYHASLNQRNKIKTALYSHLITVIKTFVHMN